jgi:cysteine-rich repeat protein
VRRALATLALLAGCTLPFPDVPSDATLSCGEDADCPPGLRCEAERCVSPEGACGDGVVAEAEACDDGNDNPADACDQCRLVTWTPELLVGRAVQQRGGAEFPGNPTALTLAPDGDLVFTITDSNAPGVFRWNRALDVVTPIAGTGAPADFTSEPALDQVATLVPLKVPLGVAVGLDDTVWLADGLNPRILRIDPATRVLSSAAGTGASAVDNSLEVAAVAARFSFLSDVVLGPVGRPHVIDFRSDGAAVVRRLDPDGFVRRVAGSFDATEAANGGPALDARLDRPNTLAFDDNGDLLIVELGGGRILRVDAAGVITTVVGGGDVPLVDGVDRLDAQLVLARGVVSHQGALHFVSGFDLWRVEGDVVRHVTNLVVGNSGLGRMVSDGESIYLADDASAVSIITDGEQTFALGGPPPPPLEAPLATTSTFRRGVHRVAARGDDVFVTFGAGYLRVTDRMTVEFAGQPVRDMEITPEGETYFLTVDEVRRASSGEVVVGPRRLGKRVSSPPLELATVATDVALPRAGVRRMTVQGGALFLAFQFANSDEPTAIYRVDLSTGALARFAGGAEPFTSGADALDVELLDLRGIAATRDALVYADGLSLRAVQDGVITERYTHDHVIVALAADGDDLYFAERSVNNINAVYRLPPGGAPERLIGDRDGSNRGDGALAVDASISNVIDLAVDDEAVYASSNARLRRIDRASGVVTSVAGLIFLDDGDVDDAQVRQPNGLLATSAGLLVTDGARATLRRVAEGTLRTVVGYPDRFEDDAPGGDGLFSRSLRAPRGLALVDGDVWLAESAGELRQISGDLTTARTRVDSGLTRPTGLTWDDVRGRVYIADPGAHVIRSLDLDDDSVSVLAGTEGFSGFLGDGGLARESRLNNPVAVLFHGPDHLYIADTDNHRVRRVDLETGVITTVLGIGVGASAGEGTATELPVDAPAGLYIDDDENLYVTSRTAVRQVTEGRVRTIFGAERDRFPEAVTECLGDIVATRADALVVADRCAGYLIELSRSAESSP